MPDIRLGIDDLYCVYAFLGSSQGDMTKTNSVIEYQRSEGWLLINHHFRKVNTDSQEDVNKRSQELQDYNEDYIEALKSIGKYGRKAPGATISIQYNPMFDNPNIIFGVDKANGKDIRYSFKIHKL